MNATITPEEVERNARRDIQLALTVRMTLTLLAIAKAARRKEERKQLANIATGWKPEPGKHDANLARIEQLDDIIRQLQSGMERSR